MKYKLWSLGDKLLYQNRICSSFQIILDVEFTETILSVTIIIIQHACFQSQAQKLALFTKSAQGPPKQWW